jgi:hypothetical protein
MGEGADIDDCPVWCVFDPRSSTRCANNPVGHARRNQQGTGYQHKSQPATPLPLPRLLDQRLELGGPVVVAWRWSDSGHPPRQ